MDKELVRLHLSQLAEPISRSAINQYSDKRKADVHAQLISLYKKIKADDLTKRSEGDLKLIKKILDYLFHCIEFLDSSTLSVIPYEVLICIEDVLKDWVGDSSDNYIILTSLSNDIDSYSIRSYDPEDFKNILAAIGNFYQLEIKTELIQLRLPKYFIHDYLFNVVLYHEIGHFIDKKYGIIKKTFSNEKNDAQGANHLAEIFADIFAAQYVGNSLAHYLSYRAGGNGSSFTHPSTSLRVHWINEFNNGSNLEFLDVLKKGTKKASERELKIRYKPIQGGSFNQFIPQIIKESGELHGLLVYGWELWINRPNQIRSAFKNEEDSYRAINNLIGKSIMNYQIREEWEAIKKYE